MPDSESKNQNYLEVDLPDLWSRRPEGPRLVEGDKVCVRGWLRVSGWGAFLTEDRDSLIHAFMPGRLVYHALRDVATRSEDVGVLFGGCISFEGHAIIKARCSRNTGIKAQPVILGDLHEMEFTMRPSDPPGGRVYNPVLVTFPAPIADPIRGECLEDNGLGMRLIRFDDQVQPSFVLDCMSKLTTAYDFAVGIHKEVRRRWLERDTQPINEDFVGEVRFLVDIIEREIEFYLKACRKHGIEPHPHFTLASHE